MITSPIEAFGRRAQEYVSGRPEYPDALLADLPRADVIVELGAGTGKFTRLLARTGARVIAVEPQAAMAAHIAPAARVEVLAGTAEAIPLPSASADLICSASAFHWFDYAKATAEILRIARPGAHLALLWNVRDERTAWVGDITRLMNDYRGTTVRSGSGIGQLLGDARFKLIRESRHAFAHQMPPESIVDRVLSTSFIAALPEAEQDVVRQRTRAIIAAHPELAGASEIGFPYICRLYLLRCDPHCDPGRE